MIFASARADHAVSLRYRPTVTAVSALVNGCRNEWREIPFSHNDSALRHAPAITAVSPSRAGIRTGKQRPTEAAADTGPAAPYLALKE